MDIMDEFDQDLSNKFKQEKTLDCGKIELGLAKQQLNVTNPLGNCLDRLDSLTNLNDNLKQLLEIAADLCNAAEMVFTYMDGSLEDNVFLNVPNLCQLLVLMASVGHTLTAKEIKELLLKMKKRSGELGIVGNSETSRLIYAQAARELMFWEHHIKQRCVFNEYTTRRRLYVNRMACRSYSVHTFQALNSLHMEIKVAAGIAELNRWAVGERVQLPEKSIFQTWEREEDKEKVEETEKAKKEAKTQPPMFKPKPTHKGSNKEKKLTSGQKCPILMATTKFEIPIHPFILDMRTTYSLRAQPFAIRAIRLINDSSRMLRHYKIGKDYCGARIPCRLKDASNTMEMLVFWSGMGNKKFYNIMALVEAILGGAPPMQQYNGSVQETVIRELHLPLWDSSTLATNIAHPISQKISDHLFTEGGFGDLADVHDVRPNAEPTSADPPSLQSFDTITIRTPEIEGQKPEDLDQTVPSEKGVMKVSLPYYMVIYDDSAKCPIYLARISKPATVKDTEVHVESKWSRFKCSIM